MAAKRPWWCQDPTCEPVSNTPWVEDAAKHELSGFCSGCVAEPRVIERHGYRHTNDMHLCFRSALRGVVMLEVNAMDMANVIRCAARAMIARRPDERFNLYWYTGRESDRGLVAGKKPEPDGGDDD